MPDSALPRTLILGSTSPYRRELLQRFDSANLSVPQFCQREGVCESSYYRWRSQLRAGQLATPALSTPTAPPTFLDLGLLGAASAPAPSPAPALELRLELGAGITLQLTRR